MAAPPQSFASVFLPLDTVLEGKKFPFERWEARATHKALEARGEREKAFLRG
jgi:hypothetical protein